MLLRRRRVEWLREVARQRGCHRWPLVCGLARPSAGDGSHLLDVEGPPHPAQWTWPADLPPWVGRRRELEQLERCWPAGEHGARQLAFIAAEPGAGKSRLVMEVSCALRARGVPVLVGQCTSDLGLPFDPLVTPIRALLTDMEAGRLDVPDDPDRCDEDTRRLLRLLTAGESPATTSQMNLEAPALRAVLGA